MSSGENAVFEILVAILLSAIVIMGFVTALK